MKRLVLALLVTLTVTAGLLPGDPNSSALYDFRRVAIKSEGRLKPLDTFARETLQSVSGCPAVKVGDATEDPVLTILRWTANPEKTADESVVEVNQPGLKEELGLASDRRWFSFKEIIDQPRFPLLQQKLARAGSQADKEGLALMARLARLQSLITGQSWTIVANPKELEGPWSSLSELLAGVAGGLSEESRKTLQVDLQKLLDAINMNDAAALETASRKLANHLKGVGPYPAPEALDQEVYYNRLQPFRTSWKLYFMSFLCLLAAGRQTVKGEPIGLAHGCGLTLGALGLALHGYGFYLRGAITGFVPVTGMYESVLGTALGVCLMALALEIRLNQRLYLTAASALAALMLGLADAFPSILEPAIRALSPVLRNNLWLSSHVITITLGFASLLLALGVSHVAIWRTVWRPSSCHEVSLQLQRLLLLGFLLLAFGTVLGTIWARFSWGRFWGWDPKEAWAFITALGYFALLHGRQSGWIDDFSMAIGAIVAFQGLLMEWYGVNYLLGKGLHAYGFGRGGETCVGLYLLAEVTFIAISVWKYRSHRTGGIQPGSA